MSLRRTEWCRSHPGSGMSMDMIGIRSGDETFVRWVSPNGVTAPIEHAGEVAITSWYVVPAQDLNLVVPKSPTPWPQDTGRVLIDERVA